MTDSLQQSGYPIARRRGLWVSVCLVMVLGLGLGWSAGWNPGWADDDDERDGLPGTRPVIEAARYKTLQAAIDALPAEGGLIWLPPGTFEISKPLVVSQSDVTIMGMGTATHIRNVDNNGQPAIVIRPPDLAKNPKVFQWRVRLKDFRLSGNPKSGPGIEAENVNELVLESLTVTAHGNNGVSMKACHENPRISQCQIHYNLGTGLHMEDCHDIIVSANQFEENRDGIHCERSFNLCMTGNNLDDHTRDGVVIHDTYGSVVTGNMIEECQGIGIVLDKDCYGITLSANVIAHEKAGGIVLRDAHGCAVTGNTFTIVQSNALVVGPDSGRITVSGNNFSDSYIGRGAAKRPPDDQTASGLVLAGTSEVVVDGNLFAGAQPRGVKLEEAASQRVLFSNNLFSASAPDPLLFPNGIVTDNLEDPRTPPRLP